MTGRAKVGTWQGKEGEPKARLIFKTDAILATYTVRKRRGAMACAGEEA